MSLIQNESSWRPNVVSKQGAIGPTQLLPGTAHDLGVDPNDPIQNIQGGARYIRQKLDKWGNYDDAVRAYHGGDDPRNWGPKGETEVARVAASAANYGAASVPPAAIPAQSAPLPPAAAPLDDAWGAPAPSSTNPLDDAWGSATANSHDRAPSPVAATGQETAGRRADQLPDRALPGNQMGVPQPTSGSNAGIVPVNGAPVSRADNGLRSVLKGISDFGVGAAGGAASVPGTAAVLIGKGLDYTGLTQGAGDNALKNSDDLQKLLASHEYNPNGWATAGGRLAGDIAATLPAAEIKIFEAAK